MVGVVKLRKNTGMPRQSTFTQAVATIICERLAAGEPHQIICRDKVMPPSRTVYAWLKVDSEFAAQYARARHLGRGKSIKRTLISEQVRKLRNEGMSFAKIAAKFEIGKMTVRDICAYRIRLYGSKYKVKEY